MKNNYSTLSNTYNSNTEQNYSDPPQPGYGYRPVKSDAGNDCKVYSESCANPGKGICSLTPCTNVELTNGICYSDKSYCELKNRCNEEEGWTWNPDNTDCNTFKCTTDGTIASDWPKNNNYRYTYIPPKEGMKAGRTLNGSCYKTKPVSDPDYSSCHNNWFSCYHNPDAGILQTWKDQGWLYDDSDGHGCSGNPKCNPWLKNENPVIATTDNPGINYFNPSFYALCEDCEFAVRWMPANKPPYENTTIWNGWDYPDME